MASFTWVPSVGASLALRPVVRRVAFGDGYEQRVTFGIHTQPEVWTVEFRARTTAEAVAIDDFLRARGAVQSFEWVTPAGVSGRFVCEEWSRSIDEPDIESVRATFKQVFDLS
jgi:phage-related protein